MTMNTVSLKVRDWTRYPGGRSAHPDDLFSGEEFRRLFLEDGIARGDDFEIDFNGIFTVGWSFLDEALGHFVSKLGEDEFRRRFRIIVDDDPDILQELEKVIAKRRKMRS